MTYPIPSSVLEIRGRMISPKGCNLSKKLLLLLNNFEETLGGRLRKLNPKDKVMNSAKGKVLMRAMYGVKVETVFIFSLLWFCKKGV